MWYSATLTDYNITYKAPGRSMFQLAQPCHSAVLRHNQHDDRTIYWADGMMG